MYNGKKILELLAERNLRQKDLLEALQTRENGSVSRFVKGDIKASRLEEIADFFGVSIDTFFEREVQMDGDLCASTGMSARMKSGANVAADVQRLKEKVRIMEIQQKKLQCEKSMLEERLKDKEFIIVQMQSRIEIMEELRKGHHGSASESARTNFGQSDDKNG